MFFVIREHPSGKVVPRHIEAADVFVAYAQLTNDLLTLADEWRSDEIGYDVWDDPLQIIVVVTDGVTPGWISEHLFGDPVRVRRLRPQHDH